MSFISVRTVIWVCWNPKHDRALIFLARALLKARVLLYFYTVAVIPREVFQLRCSCKKCGTWMIQSESDFKGCVCPTPGCDYRCNDCQGTDTVVQRDQLASLAFDPRFFPENLAASFEPDEEDDREYWTNGGF